MGIAPYAPRYFRFHDIWDVDGLRVKFYSITQARDIQPAEVTLTAAHDYSAKTLSMLRREEGPDHGLGYAMVHFGEMSNWLLVHWWAHQDIALRLLASTDDQVSPRFVSRDHHRFHACVWEHVVIDHERNAWVRHVMSTPSQPENYLTDWLADGTY